MSEEAGPEDMQDEEAPNIEEALEEGDDQEMDTEIPDIDAEEERSDAKEEALDAEIPDIDEEEDATPDAGEDQEKQIDSAEDDLDAEIMADLENFDADDDPDFPQESTGITDASESIESTENTENIENIENAEEMPDFAAEAAMLSGQEIPETGEMDENVELSGEDDMSENGEIGIPPSEFDDAANLEEERLSDEVDEESKKKNIVEGALFVAGRPVSLEELNIKTEIRKRELAEILKDLAMDYLMRSTALEIVQIQDKFSLQIKPEYTPNVKKFASGGLIPDKHLKTLTIIALKQPLLKSMLVKIRGSGAYDHVKFLLDRGFIEGRKKGRSMELTTTDQFADTFGLSRDLDTLKKQMITQLGIPEK